MNQEYLSMFIDETREHLKAWSDSLLKLENAYDEAIIPVIFRAAHTIKGMAMTMGFTKMGEVTHQAENLLDELRTGNLSLSSAIVDVLFGTLDVLEDLLSGIEEKGEESPRDIAFILEKLGAIPEEAALSVVQDAPESQGMLDAIRPIAQQAMREGFRVFEMTIGFTDRCIMPMARWAQVLREIDQDSLLYTYPDAAALEEGTHEGDITFVVALLDDIEPLGLRIASVSEVMIRSVREWRIDHESSESGSSESGSSESGSSESGSSESGSSESGSAVAGENMVPEGFFAVQDDGYGTSAPGDNLAAKTRADMASGKRKASSTIRVDTEKLDSLMNLFSELVIDKTRLEQIQSELGHLGLTETVSHMSRVSNQLQELVMSIRMVPVDTVFSRFPRMVRDTAKQLGKVIEFTMIGTDTELDRTVVEEIGDPIMHMLRNSLDHGIELQEGRRRVGKPDNGHITLRAYEAGNRVFIEVEDDGGGIDRDKVLRRAIDKGVVSRGENLTDHQVFQLLFASGFSTADTVTDLSGRGVGLDVVKSKIESLSGKVDIYSEPGKGTKFVIQLPMTLAILDGLMVQVNRDPYFIPIASISEIVQEPEIKWVNSQEVTVWREKVIPVVCIRTAFEEPDTADRGYLIVVQKGEEYLGLVVDEVFEQREVVLKNLDRLLGSIRYFSGATILGDGSVALVIDPNAFFDWTERRTFQ